MGIFCLSFFLSLVSSSASSYSSISPWLQTVDPPPDLSLQIHFSIFAPIWSPLPSFLDFFFVQKTSDTRVNSKIMIQKCDKVSSKVYTIHFSKIYPIHFSVSVIPSYILVSVTLFLGFYFIFPKIMIEIEKWIPKMMIQVWENESLCCKSFIPYT
jgi:hypothetical protein